MATVDKNFRIKNGLVVEGTTATVNAENILTEGSGDNYIISLIGGQATSANTPSTVVKRDVDGSFAANVVTTNTVYVGGTTSNGIGILAGTADTEIGSNDGIQLTASDDIRLVSGNGNIVLNPDGGAYLFSASSGNEVQTKDAVDQAITTALGTAQGYADAVAQDLSDHEALSSGVHGVTGSVVGTTDTQDLSNKRFIDTTYFTDGVTISNEGQIAVISPSHEFEVKANVGPLGLKSYNDDIVLTPGSGKDVKWGADVLATQSYADGAAGAVQDNLDDHTSATSAHGVTGDIVGTTDTQTISNKTLGSDLAAGGYKVSGLADPTADQDSATKAYVDDAISALVDGAPALLDTLNELAAAINDDEGFSGTIATSIGEKVAKAGDSMSGDLDFGGTHKVTSLATPTSSTDAATKGYVDGEISSLDTDAQGYASSAQTAAELYADGVGTSAVSTANSYTDGEVSSALGTASGYASTAETNANSYTDTAVGNVLDGDSAFTAVNVNSVAGIWAAVTTVASASTVTAWAYNAAVFTSAKLLVSIKANGHSQVSEVLVTLDSTGNVAITEFGIVGTNGSLGEITALNSSGNVSIRVTTAYANSDVIVYATTLA